jgi:hypothetical protein
VGQGPGWRDDQDATGDAPGGELGHYQAGLDGLAQADAVRQQQPGPAHAKGAQGRDELVGFEAEPARLDGQQGVGAQCLFEQEGLVVDEPVPQGAGLLRLQLVDDRCDGFEGVEQVKFLAAQGACHAPQADERLRTQLLGEDNLPAQAAGVDFGAREQGGHERLLCGIFAARQPVGAR